MPNRLTRNASNTLVPKVGGTKPDGTIVGAKLDDLTVTAGKLANDATAGQMVEEHDSLGRPQRVVVRQRHDAGSQLDALGACGCGGDEDLGGGDDLAAGRVVLTDPRLVETERVHVLQEVEVGLERQGRVVLRWVERCHEGAET